MVISLRTVASSVPLSSVRTFRTIVVIAMFMTASVVGGGLVMVVVLGVILFTVVPVVISLTWLSICIVSIRAVVVSVWLPVRAAIAGTTVSVVGIILVFVIMLSSAPPTIGRHQID